MEDTTPLNNENVKAVYLTAEDLKIAGSILYQAYHDDPLFMDIFQADKDDYEPRLRSAIREELGVFWQARQPMIGLFEEERLLAVACLNSPSGGVAPGRFWHWRLKMLLTAGLFSTRQLVEKEERVKAHMPADIYHMLAFIGVHPDYQHRGLGHLLMSAVESVMLEDPNSEGVGVFVTLPKCLGFFEDGAYDQVNDLKVGQVTGQVMFRARPDLHTTQQQSA